MVILARLWGELTRAAKHLACAEVGPETSAVEDQNAYLQRLAEAVVGAHQAGHMTLVIVNQVKRARDLRGHVAELLKSRGDSAPGLALRRFAPAICYREWLGCSMWFMREVTVSAIRLPVREEVLYAHVSIPDDAAPQHLGYVPAGMHSYVVRRPSAWANCLWDPLCRTSMKPSRSNPEPPPAA